MTRPNTSHSIRHLPGCRAAAGKEVVSVALVPDPFFHLLDKNWRPPTVKETRLDSRVYCYCEFGTTYDAVMSGKAKP